MDYYHIISDIALSIQLTGNAHDNYVTSEKKGKITGESSWCKGYRMVSSLESIYFLPVSYDECLSW